jgi:hypothetical protein
MTLVEPYISYFISIFPMILAGIIIFISFFRTNYKPQILMGVCWLLLGIFNLFNVLGFVLEGPASIVCILICSYLWIPIGFSMSFLLDSISKDTVEPIKIAVVSAISALLIYSSLEENAIIPLPLTGGYIGWDWNGSFKLSILLISAYISIAWFYFCLKIYINSPKNIKLHAFFLLWGAFFVGILPLILVATNLNILFLGSEAICMSIGAIICTIEFAKFPKLIFILPFKAINLTVINTTGGLPLFKYNWVTESESVDEMLFSGMIQGISCILNEAVHKGEAQEIKMKNGILILNYDSNYPLAFVLVSTKSSKMLKAGLELFAKRFILKFSHVKFSDIATDVYQEYAETLLKECFSFIP